LITATKVRKQGIIFRHEIFLKLLLAHYMIKEFLPKIEIKLLKISHVRILFLVSLLFVAVINPY